MFWFPVLLILPYFFLLLRSYRSLLNNRTFNISEEPATSISVVVACHNEQKNLPVLLNCLSLQNYPKNLYEVIIVDDNSTDNTVEIAEGYNRINNIRVLNNTRTGKKTALRTGIMSAKGSLIISTDADCKMGKNWIRTIAGYYEITGADLIICPVLLTSIPGLLGRFQELEFLSLQGITAGSSLSGNATMCNGANLAFKKGVYLNHSANLHDEINSGDDIFLLHSLKREELSGIRWLESYDALVTADSKTTVGSFLKQRSRWISKSGVYRDKDTIFLGIAAFIATLLQLSYLAGCIFCPALIWTFLSVLILKSIPDFLILMNTTRRYKKSNLMWWFLPSQLIYPVYVLSVVFYALIFRKK
jgi:poly-beta-1,6-N-acetyl-D-glucosamine synthase